MKIEIKNKEIIKKVLKEVRDVYRKYNAYPMMNIDIRTGDGKYTLYELDKLTEAEKKGTLQGNTNY